MYIPLYTKLFSPDGKYYVLFFITKDYKNKVAVYNSENEELLNLIDKLPDFDMHDSDVIGWRYDSKAFYLKGRNSIRSSLATVFINDKLIYCSYFKGKMIESVVWNIGDKFPKVTTKDAPLPLPGFDSSKAQNKETLKCLEPPLFDYVQHIHSMGESGLGAEYSYIKFRNIRTKELYFQLEENFIDIVKTIWSDDGFRFAFAAEYDTDSSMFDNDNGIHIPAAAVVDVLNCKLLKVFDYDKYSTLEWTDDQQSLKGLGNGFESVADFIDSHTFKTTTPSFDEPVARISPFHEIIGPKTIAFAPDGQSSLSVDAKGQVVVKFSDGIVMEVTPNCKMLSADHLICWTPDSMQVGFFARHKGEDCMCIIRKKSDDADMWYLHSVPTDVAVDTIDGGKYYISPIINGKHVYKAPFYFDDFEMVPNVVHSDKDKDDVADSDKDKENTVDSDKDKENDTRTKEEPVEAKEADAKNENKSHDNKLLIIVLSICAAFFISLASVSFINGHIKSGVEFLVCGFAGISMALIDFNTSTKSLLCMVLAWFVALVSTLTFQIAKGVNALIVMIMGWQPNPLAIFIVEGTITIASLYTFAILGRRAQSYNQKLLYEWLYMASFSLIVGFLGVYIV